MTHLKAAATLFVLIVLVAAIGGCLDQRFPVPGPAEPTGEVACLAPTDAPRHAATQLNVEAECSATVPGTRLAKLRWNTAKRSGGQQRVDVTMFRDGFEDRKFETIAQLSGDDTEISWDGGDPGISYYWRVLTLTRKGWVSSQLGRYAVPVCPVDYASVAKGPD